MSTFDPTLNSKKFFSIFHAGFCPRVLRLDGPLIMVPIDFWRNSDLFEKKRHFPSSKTVKVRALLRKSIKFFIENR